MRDLLLTITASLAFIGGVLLFGAWNGGSAANARPEAMQTA